VVLVREVEGDGDKENPHGIVPAFGRRGVTIVARSMIAAENRAGSATIGQSRAYTSVSGRARNGSIGMRYRGAKTPPPCQPLKVAWKSQ
jgi:hypothetical protein